METVARYVLYFFFYSALGWFVESCYCSVRPRKWVNRGFLTGPLCPIYGTGALVFLVLVEPIRKLTLTAELFGHRINFTYVAVFFAGLVFADIVEFTVSLLMEKLFHARWWDYSNNFLNIQGRICFKHSIYWGTASIVFLCLIHPFFDRWFSKIPIKAVYIILACVLVVFFIDVFDAVRKALDVRKLMDKLNYFRDYISSVFAFEDDEPVFMGEQSKLHEKLSEFRELGTNQWNEIKESFDRLSQPLKKTKGEKGKRRNRMFMEFPMMKNFASEQLKNIEEKLEKLVEKFKP